MALMDSLGNVVPVLQTLAYWAPEIVSVLATLVTVLTTVHIVLHKQDTRAAIGWIGLNWLVPLVGAALYLILGINRIRRRAEELRSDFTHFVAEPSVEPVPPGAVTSGAEGDYDHFNQLARMVNKVVRRPLVPGNLIEPLFNGDQAYPAMLEAIDAAQKTVNLSTYIFDNDTWGKRFADRMGEAVDRGVEVRVLIDAAGLRYSFPSIMRRLKRRGVEAARFLPSIFPPHLMSVNLRNHRKIMVIDGELGFTGGMNIRTAHVIADEQKMPTSDLHFRLRGPVVSQLQEVFVDDWYFATQKELRGEGFFPPLKTAGDKIARGISDGPDEDLDKLPWALLGALTRAERSVRVVTPYFLPDESVVDALNVAAMRGLEVDVIMPAKNNLPYVQWASFGRLRPLLEHEVRVWLTPPPFEHSKLLVVDRFWTLFGSSNWDPRSHRLNFEFDVECYDASFGCQMDDWAQSKLDGARRITLEQYDSRSLFRRLRDGSFRLLQPYL